TQPTGAALSAPSSASLSIDENSEATPVFNATEGQLYNGPLGVYYDGSGTPASVSINWGDGQNSAGTATGVGEPGVFQIAGSHLYAEEGSFPVTITITNTNSSVV